MDNYDIAHKFFYDLSGYFKKHYMNVSYNNYKFYSYGTIIGKVIEDRDGNYILLVSENNFSNTTCRHIANLLGACPFSYLHVPVKMYDRDINIDDLEKTITKKLDFYKNEKLSLKQNRNEYIRYFDMLNTVSNKIVKIKKAVIKKYEKLYNDLQNSEAVKRIKHNEHIKAQKAADKLKKELAKITKSKNLCELAQMAYGYNNGVNSELKAKIKMLINPLHNYAFAWIKDDTFETSKGIEIKIKDCMPLIRLYKAGKVKHGLKLNQYTVLEVTEKFITIGCHKIPAENIKQLIASL
jgi:hypothetical protein